MAYKDEYEVARLYSDPAFLEGLREQFSGDLKLQFNLAPPGLRAQDASGRPRKRVFGGWMLLAFRLLAPFKFLRGTVFDPLGYFAERRMERRLIAEYRELIERVADRLNAQNLDAAIALAQAARDIAGYGPVKHAAAQQYETRLPRLLSAFESAGLATRAKAA
jgi:indolepyruvate ferredoxin oxidoreductase